VGIPTQFGFGGVYTISRLTPKINLEGVIYDDEPISINKEY